MTIEMTTTTEVKNRYTGEVICEGSSIGAACEANRTALVGADLDGADLRGADLRESCLDRAKLRWANLSEADLEGSTLAWADLRGADLRGADLRGAALYMADLRGADLRGACLDGAYLAWADLRGANLRGAELRGAELGEADLRGALLSWRSHDLVAEILRREAGNDIAKRKVAGLVLASRDMCWEDFLALGDPLTDWALSVLRGCVVLGDDAPEELRGSCVEEGSDCGAGVTE